MYVMNLKEGLGAPAFQPCQLRVMALPLTASPFPYPSISPSLFHFLMHGEWPGPRAGAVTVKLAHWFVMLQAVHETSLGDSLLIVPYVSVFLSVCVSVRAPRALEEPAGTS